MWVGPIPFSWDSARAGGTLSAALPIGWLTETLPYGRWRGTGPRVLCLATFVAQLGVTALEIIIGLTVFVAVITLVGHGFWVFFRFLGRLFTGFAHDETTEAIPAEICPSCGMSWPKFPKRGDCPTCGWRAGFGRVTGPPRPQQTARVLRQLEDRIQRYIVNGLIPEEVGRQILEALPEVQTDYQTKSSPYRAPEPRLPPKPAMAEVLGEDDLLIIPETPVTAPPPRALLPDAAREPEIHILDRPEPVAAPRRTWLEVLGAFQEESNIRWGELVGGLLIVGCSLALVISFWSRIAERPFLKFGLFNGVTALIYLLGLHASKKWQLPNTSRGLLIIAAMLTPLNFLAVAALGKGESSSLTNVLTLGGEVVAVGLFAWLIFQAGRILATSAASSLVVSVLVPSASMLGIGRLIGVADNWLGLAAIGAVPLVAQSVGQARWFRLNRDEPEINQGRAFELLNLLGLGLFAAGLAVGLIVWQGETAGFTARDLAPLSPLAGLALLAPGIALWTRSGGEESGRLRVIGASIATGGVLCLLAGTAFAWPSPGPLLTVCILNVAILSILGVAMGLPMAHAFAGCFLAAAYLLVWGLGLGRFGWQADSELVSQSLLGNLSAGVLLPLSIAYACGAYLWLGRGRRDVALPLGMVAWVTSGYSAAVATWNILHLGDAAHGASWIFLTLALGYVTFSLLFGRRPLVAETGVMEASVLAWAGAVFGFMASFLGLAGGEWKPWFAIPGIVSVVVDALASVAVASALWSWARRKNEPIAGVVATILDRWSLVAAGFATLLVIVSIPNGQASSLALYSFLIAFVYAVTCYGFRSAIGFGVFQATVTLSVGLAVQSVLIRQVWYPLQPYPMLDPRSLQALGLALAAMCGGWLAIRLAARRYRERSGWVANWEDLLEPGIQTFDQLLRDGLVLLLAGLVLYGVVPGLAQELTPRDMAARLAGLAVEGRIVPPISAFEWGGIAHAPAYGWATWLLWASVLGLLVGGAFERLRGRHVLAGLVVLSLLAPLVSARWETDVAAASAMRWAGSLTVLGMSALIWTRDRWASLARRLGLIWESGRFELHGLATIATLVIAALPWVFMGGYSGVFAVLDRPLHPSVESAGPATLVICMGLLLVGGMIRVSIPYLEENPRSVRLKSSSTVLMTLAALPIVVLTTFAVMTAFVGNPIVGPEPGTFFRRIGNAGSYVPPLLVFAATLVGFAIRERSSGFAFSATVMMNLAATSGFLMLTAQRGQGLSAELAVRLCQLNVIMASLGGLAWIASVYGYRRRLGRESETYADGLLALLGSISLSLVGIVLGTALFGLWVEPHAPVWVTTAGDPLGLLALILVGGFLGAQRWVAGRPFDPSLGGGWATALAGFVGLSSSWLGRDAWESLHFLIDALAVTSLLPVGVCWQLSRTGGSYLDRASRDRLGRWCLLTLVLIALFGMRTYSADPQSPWWTVAALLYAGIVGTGLAAWMGHSRYFLFAAGCFNLAASFWWGSTAWWNGSAGSTSALGDMVRANIAALAIPCTLWCWVERRYLRINEDARVPWYLPFHEHMSRIALIGLVLTLSIGLGRDAWQENSTPTQWLGWVAFVSTAVAIAVGLWDPWTRRADFRLYLLGLATCGWLVHIFHLPPRWLAWTGTVVLAAYGVGTSYLWSQRSKIAGMAGRIGMVVHDERERHYDWLIPSNIVLAIAVFLLAFGIVLNDADPTLRQVAAQAALAQALSIGLLSVGERRLALQRDALMAGMIGLIAVGWGLIAPTDPTRMLDRGAVVVMATILAGTFYGLGLSKILKRENDWTQAGEEVVPWMFGLQVLAIVGLVGLEGIDKLNGQPILIRTAAAIAVAVSIGWWALSSILAAVIPGRDIFGLTERGRTAYVYAAEVMLAVLGAHLSLSMSWLFSGLFAKYWVLIVMGLAFLGVGLSELFRRQGRMVLSEPLERTGGFLPALPMFAAIWLTPRPGEDVFFLVLVGVLYSVISLMRSSLVMGALATLAFNGALWTLLSHSQTLAFAQHPQIWVIPPALCLLAGGYLNRDRLTVSQQATIRYIAALAIYVSSTTEIVLTGVGQAPWLPVVLAGLSICGIFAGILLRIRGFLFLGTGFLGLAVFSVIWHAAVDLQQTWLWWASGIVTGVLILAMFALFEKKREEIRKVVVGLKDWSV